MTAHDQECRLCRQIRPLCRSHIVPELAYKPIKNDKGQMYEVGYKAKKIQTGYFEKLLCAECERLLSSYESKFKQVWMSTIPPDFRHLRTRPLRDIIRVDVPDYASFKLFHLSVFWRAAVSRGFRIGSISLGPYEEVVRAMLRCEDPGCPGDLPFLGFLSLDDGAHPVPIVSQLAEGKGRFEGHHYYMMSYAFCDWIFVVAQPGPTWLTDLEKQCRQEGMFLLLTVPYTQSKSFRLSVQILRKLWR